MPANNKKNSYTVKRSIVCKPTKKEPQSSHFKFPCMNEIYKNPQTISSWSIKKNGTTSTEALAKNEADYKARVIAKWRNRISMRDY